MTLAIVYTRASIGMEAPLVTVEAHISNGLPGLTLVGLPETAVKEARDRVRSALLNSGFEYPAKKMTVNLAPADLPKESGRYDLAIAIAILASSGQIPNETLNQHEFLGELALSGLIRYVNSAIPAAQSALEQRRVLILSIENQHQLSLLADNSVHFATSLLELCHFLHGKQVLASNQQIHEAPSSARYEGDINDIIGQEQGKRALEICATGGHNLLLLGPPGTGKTMLASRLMTLLPPLTPQEALEVASLYSLTETTRDKVNWPIRPFRTPHHSTSIAALIGGGSLPKPGEISLAHNGILFLDELPEFSRSVLDSLREPLESKRVSISRAKAKVCYPANFQLIAALNPSPTGHYQGEMSRSSPARILRYLSHISGPFLDRFDISIEIPLLPIGSLSNQNYQGETSEQIRQRVITARNRQLERAGKINNLLTSRETTQFCPLKAKDALFLEHALNKLGLSIRAWHRVLRVSRTIADLNASEHIERAHLLEALGYRTMDKLLLHLQKQVS
ncbi:YifB family Mg chelatase-like AAA ATPase [Providencia rettgeri]|uniref:YifB family Mg chelatase-like AAA ATPase n=1 Tax=Providencia TaxID=586 RepID=UPI001B361FD3|nr:YifB family Mg chelatase-like AAA ATPase [Providencia rettgeri]EJD6402286.1 YifB family Mg chelatase-like AAA ATPase [Providencia rettgeri]EJD6614799.1 YifB family Mg chelatase-like AAA ATPase [Providencia rettgeri]ELL9149491.1 YifB family Mg chelatase-like AAA ATPase [Providencia rettgeri]ELR5241755.1 YifB family Mg chelatase-like AAA ATPase [Providencia rettgeri]ELR5253541.1 YifB family Mg chelatase-like AAA ATPase [Providencia rettgeri]